MDESEKFSISFSPTAVRHECLITFVQLFNTLRQPTALITIFSHQHFSSTLFFRVSAKSQSMEHLNTSGERDYDNAEEIFIFFRG